MVLRLVGGESGWWVWVVGRSGIGCWSWNHDAAKCLPECLPSASLSQGSWKGAAAGSLIGRYFRTDRGWLFGRRFDHRWGWIYQLRWDDFQVYFQVVGLEVPVYTGIMPNQSQVQTCHKQLAGDFRSLVFRLGKLGNVLQQDKGLVEV